MRTYRFSDSCYTIEFECDGIADPNEAPNFKVLVDILTGKYSKVWEKYVTDVVDSKKKWTDFLTGGQIWLARDSHVVTELNDRVYFQTYSDSEAQNLAEFLNERGVKP